MKKNNNFSFLLQEGVRAIFKHGFMSFAAICITVACLVIVSSFGLITYNLNLIVEDLQKENEVLVCIDENYTGLHRRIQSGHVRRRHGRDHARPVYRHAGG